MIAKYRAKRIGYNDWVYGVPMYLDGRCWILNVPRLSYFNEDSDCYLEINQFEVDPETVGQWTGLKDKDGTDIYQDDIVLIKFDEVWYHSRNEIEERKNEEYFATGKTLYTACRYLNGRFTFRCFKAIDDETGERCEDLENRNYEVKWRCKRYEVIGNIHQNPELAMP